MYAGVARNMSEVIVTDRLRNAGWGESQAPYYCFSANEIAALADKNARE